MQLAESRSFAAFDALVVGAQSSSTDHGAGREGAARDPTVLAMISMDLAPILTALWPWPNDTSSMSSRAASASAVLPSTSELALGLSLVLISLLTPGCGPPF